MSGVMDERQLFEIEAPPPVSLADKFGVPPFSVLDLREWIDDLEDWLVIAHEMFDHADDGRTERAESMGNAVYDGLRALLADTP